MKSKRLVFSEDEADEKLQDPEISSTSPDKELKGSGKKSRKSKKSAGAESGASSATKEEEKKGKETPKKKVSLVREPPFLKAPVSKRPIIPRSDGNWWELLKGADEVVTEETELTATEECKGAFEAYAKRLAAVEAERKGGGGQEEEWMRTAAKGGTAADQVAALALLVQASPLRSLPHLASLSARLRSGRHEALATLPTARDLWLQSLLPERKLVPFQRRPLLRVEALSGDDAKARDGRLLLWHFEDGLRQAYSDFTREVQRLCHDSVAATRIAATSTALELLSARPEAEAFLLGTIVNKLGDTEAKVAAHVARLLLRLLAAHPNMSTVVVTEVERLLFRPNIAQQAQFYAVSALSQVTLKAADAALAAQLVRIYLALFQILIAKASVEHRMLGALMAGTNRAFPYARSRLEGLGKLLKALYKVAATAPLPTAIQTLALLYEALDSEEGGDGLSDRFYSALYRLLRAPELLSSPARHAALFNLLYKALKGETSEARLAAFVRRLLELALAGSGAFAAALLLLLSALRTERPNLLTLIKKAQKPMRVISQGAEDSDEEETFRDIDLDGEEKKEREGPAEEKEEKSRKPSSSSWIHRENLRTGKERAKLREDYDPEARNPSFAGAEASLPYELVLLTRHYHPSVALFASQLVAGKELAYDGDPLQDFTLIRFLDRLAFRNPKQAKKDSGEGGEGKADAAKPRVGIQSRRRAYVPPEAKRLPVDSQEYLSLRGGAIPPDERFLHSFVAAAGPKKRRDGEKDGEDSDGDSVASDEAERMIGAMEVGDAARDSFEVNFEAEFGSEAVIKRRRKGRAQRAEDGEDDEVSSSGDEAEEVAELLERGDVDDEEGFGASKAGKRRGKAKGAKADRGRKRRRH